MSAVADGVGCGLCAPAARGRGRESGQRRESSGAERGGEGTGQRETASPMVLHCVVGEEVAATLRTSEIRLGGSFFV